MALISKVWIARLALSHIKSKTQIESLTQRTPAADQCNLWFDVARRETLALYDWTFARKRVALQAASEDPPADWAYAYKEPSDLVAARYIWNPANGGASFNDAWQVSSVWAPNGRNAPVPFYRQNNATGDQKLIFTNMNEAVLVYTWDQEDVNMFEPAFVTAFSHVLASRIAPSLTGSDRVRDAQYQLAVSMVRTASAVDANAEARQSEPTDAPWIAGR